jgi:hypothetical protein
MTVRDARHLKETLARRLVLASGLEQRRDYLGMSQIGRCPRELYRLMLNEKMTGERDHWFCWLGYLYESAIVELLGGEPMWQGIEVVAEFDERFRGHVDYQLDRGGVLWDLVEIKSTSYARLQSIIKAQAPVPFHVAQVQAYMRHGYWERAFLVYVARDAPGRDWRGMPIWVFELGNDPRIGAALDRKARTVLAAVDAGVAPACTCGRCG